MTGTRRGGRSRNAHPGSKQSAIARLDDCRSHQQSFFRDVRHNWHGWLSSMLFHVVLLAFFATITWTILSQPREYVIDIPPVPENTKVETEPLESILMHSLHTTKPDRVASTRDLTVKTPRIGSFDRAEDPGATNLIGNGFTHGGPGWGGKPGGPGGDGIGDGIIGTWGRQHPVDVVFVFDATGSMGDVILEVKTRIRQFMNVITTVIPEARVGLVAYRDKRKYDLGDYEWTVRFTPLTSGDERGIAKLQRFLRETDAYGGGDIPEAVYDGLKAAIDKMGWRNDQKTRRVIVIFGDAPPRPESNGLAKIYDLCREWHKKTGGIISCIDTTGESKLMDEFRQMASDGGGRSTSLNNPEDIVKQLFVYIFPEKLEKEAGDFVKNMIGGTTTDTVLEE